MSNTTPIIVDDEASLLSEAPQETGLAAEQALANSATRKSVARLGGMLMFALAATGGAQAKSPAGFSQDGISPAVVSTDSTDRPPLVFVAGGTPSVPVAQPAPQVANLPPVAPIAKETAKTAPVVVGVEIAPGFEQYKTALEASAASIQALIEQTNGVRVKQVLIKTVDRGPIRNPDGKPDWGRVVGGLNNPIAKPYSIAGLTAKSTAAKGDSYARIDELLTWVADENRRENFEWRTVYINEQEPNRPFTAEQQVAYRYDMREFRENFRAQLAANPRREEITQRMMLALEKVQQEVGNMPMGALYRLAFTGRLDLWAELAILHEELPTAAAAEKPKILQRIATINSTAGLTIADTRALFARMVVNSSLPVAKSIIPDAYLLLPSDKADGEPRPTSISHFYPQYKAPETKGMRLGATQGYVTLDGTTLLRENFPYLDAATGSADRAFTAAMLATVRDMPAQVAAANEWGIKEYNKLASLMNNSRDLLTTMNAVNDIVKRRQAFVFDTDSRPVYDRMTNLARSIRT